MADRVCLAGPQAPYAPPYCRLRCAYSCASSLSAVQCDLAPLTLPEPVSILPNSPHLTLLTLRVFLSSSISPFQCRCSVPKGSPFMTSFNWYLSFQPLRCCYCCCCMTETALSLGEKKKGPFSCIFFCHAISSTSANNK